MSATYNANITIQQNASIAQTLYGGAANGSIYSPGGVPSLFISSSYSQSSGFVFNDGTVRVTGFNNGGQLGQNDLVTRSTLVPILGISSQAIAVAFGKSQTAILLNNGTVRVCGYNNSGQLGLNDLTTRSTVVSVLGISSQAVAVACGSYQTAILLNDGTIRVCGRNNSGQLGTNDLVTRSTVVSVLGISSQAISVSVGWFHMAAILNNGTVRVWGRNNAGNLGQNDLTIRSTSVPVLGISSQAIAACCGYDFTAILLNDGTVRVCGQNSNGQLGTNDLVTRSTVVSVLGISSQAIAIACGAYHTAILLNDGTVRVCGRNAEGQLGQNDLNNRSTVVSVLGISSQAIAVACGQYHTAILLNDGTIRVCGRNDFGQLGLNDAINRSTTVPVLGSGSVLTLIKTTNINSLFSSISFDSGFIMSDGTVRMCGLNSNGQLGQNDLVTRSTVVSVLGISSQAVSVACGQGHTAILLNDGTVRVCGRNSDGQLGQNDIVTRSTVVSVLGIGTLTLQAPSLLLGLTSASSYQLDMSTDNARKLTTSTWTTGSDQALKTNIVDADLERCVDIIQQLELKYFRWNIPSDDTHSLGWIAQDVEPLLPKAVTTSPTHGIPDFKDLNSDQIIKVMWGALKKLRAELKAKKTL